MNYTAIVVIALACVPAFRALYAAFSAIRDPQVFGAESSPTETLLGTSYRERPPYGCQAGMVYRKTETGGVVIQQNKLTDDYLN